MSPKTLLNILLPKGERRHHRVSKVQQTLSRHCAAAADFVLYYTKGDNCLCSSGPQITTTPHYYCRSTRAAACRYPDENWEARHQKQRSYSSQLYTWLRHFSRQPEFELRGILLMIYYISWDFKLCQKVMCTSNSIQKSWQLSKPSDHDEAWNLSLPPQKTNHWIQNPPKMGLERILGWTILALLIANCQGKMTYFLKKVCLIYKSRGIF